MTETQAGDVSAFSDKGLIRSA